MTDGEDKPQWFVMRDLKRPNALRPAYIDLADKGFEVFTPLRNVLKDNRGRSIRTTAPFIPDLLFVRSTRPALDREVAATPTLQYRFVRGKAANTPLTVRDEDMDRFVKAVRTVDNPNYYTPDDAATTHQHRRRSTRWLRGDTGHSTRLQVKKNTCRHTRHNRRGFRGRRKIHQAAIDPQISRRRYPKQHQAQCRCHRSA